MKPLLIFALISLPALPSLAKEMIKIEALPSLTAQIMSCDPNPGSCRVTDQSGSAEPWDCRDAQGVIRCYADVEYGNGTRLRVWGGCYSSYSDCWSMGSGAVKPCD